jgi:hypothetical protein
MNRQLWLAFCGAIAVMLLGIGSVNAENVSDTATNDVSAQVDTMGLNLSEQSSDSFWYGGYYPYYRNYGYYPYYFGYPYYGYPYYTGLYGHTGFPGMRTAGFGAEGRMHDGGMPDKMPDQKMPDQGPGDKMPDKMRDGK